MCKTGFGIRDDGVCCQVCGADGAVTPLAEKTYSDDDLDYAVCEICNQTGAVGMLTDDESPVLTYPRMQMHINRAMNVAVEQISARMIEYLDSMGEPRG